MERAVREIGYVTGTHGLKGVLRCKLSAAIDSFCAKEINSLLLKKNEEWHAFELRWKSVVPRKLSGLSVHYLMEFSDISSVEEASSWVSAKIGMWEKDLKPLAEGEIYYEDLFGLEVWDGRNEVMVGTVVDVFYTGSNDVLSVKNAEGKFILIPFIKDVVQFVDRKAKRITIIPVPGLL